MTWRPRPILALTLAVACSTGSAWAFVVSDSATTARNAVTAALKSHIVDTVLQQRDRLGRMAARLSAVASLERYRTGAPMDGQDSGTVPFVRALAGGHEDVATSYADGWRERTTAPVPAESAVIRDDIARQLATLDVADASAIAAATQLALMRRDDAALRQVLDQLERDVLNPSAGQSATAVLDKLSASAVIEAHQKQQRMQMLASLAEQLMVEAKRARDTETGALNMQRNRMLADDGEDGGLLTGAADDLRTWRQP